MKPRYKVVAGALRLSDGRVLLVKRPPEKKHGGLWEFPGGKLEKGETPEEALKRELREELDIFPEDFKLLGTINHNYGDFEIELFLFEVRKFKGKPVLKEAVEMKWVYPEEAKELKLCPADRRLLALF